jgi:hypothetical protein
MTSTRAERPRSRGGRAAIRRRFDEPRNCSPDGYRPRECSANPFAVTAQAPRTAAGGAIALGGGLTASCQRRPSSHCQELDEECQRSKTHRRRSRFIRKALIRIAPVAVLAGLAIAPLSASADTRFKCPRGVTDHKYCTKIVQCKVPQVKGKTPGQTSTPFKQRDCKLGKRTKAGALAFRRERSSGLPRPPGPSTNSAIR